MLKICYLSMILLFVGCDSNTAKQENSPAKTISTTKKEVIDKTSDKVILFFGNSLTAGMGLDPDESFPSLIQNKLDSLKKDYLVINSGLSGETTASGKNRLNWVLKQEVDIFVLELGANDGLRGIPLKETKGNLQNIMDQVRGKYPQVKIILAGMQIPPNMGSEYTTEFKNIFPELAAKNKVALIPFLLKDVAGRTELNQEDGIHPTSEGQKIVAENVWLILKPLLEE